MNHTDEELTRLFDRAFDHEAPGDGLWEHTRAAMRRKVRARQAMVAACAAVVAALVVAVPQVLLSQRTGPDLQFYEPPPPVEEPEAEPETEQETAHTEKPLHLTPTPSDDAVAPAPLSPAAPGPGSDEPASPPQADPAPEGPPEPSAQELTDWYSIHLDEEIDAGARHFSARQAMDALVANMRFADGARVSHGITDAQESSATGWIDVTGAADDAVSGEEIRVRLGRDDGGWFVEPVGQARARCARGVEETERSRCV